VANKKIYRRVAVILGLALLGGAIFWSNLPSPTARELRALHNELKGGVLEDRAFAKAQKAVPVEEKREAQLHARFNCERILAHLGIYAERAEGGEWEESVQDYLQKLDNITYDSRYEEALCISVVKDAAARDMKKH
jgi:hypothetical protein